MNLTAFGTTPDGREVQEVVLSNEHLTAHFLTLGARINGLSFAGFEGLTPVLDIARATGEDQYSGVIVGPVINRLGGAKAALDGAALSFEANEGPNLLHSGKDGVHAKVWDVVSASETAVTFAVDLEPDAFPGRRQIVVTYRLQAPDLVVEIAAKTDAPTLMNVGFHPYWTLSRKGRAGHRLLIAADQYLPTGPGKISTGDVASVDGTTLDYREMRDADFDIDHCFVRPDDTGMWAAVVLESDDLRLEISTDAPAIQVFTGHGSGVAVEPEIHPDAPNHTHFPTVRLGPGETFRQTTVHRFSKR